ncbi:glycosyltransferase [Halomonas sp. TRM85114]|uniref:glycosyltransferase n=1 Tax=Halomonas jincaotanensis TaxID=2810616 RepID=UPI001BD2AAD5|nr:glycosyltransferase [Halomonas jincaotanensis]MBS9405028.1 glycosyltransferase [Halomonas jincaotanensis]
MFICSIFLDARSSGAGIPQRLAALKEILQRLDNRLELLVVDDTGDRRLAVLTKHHRAILIHAEGTPLGDRLNLAVTHSQGEVLLFPVQSTTLTADWLIRTIESIEHHERDAVVITRQPSSRLARLWRRLHSHPFSDTLCVSRVWFDRIGGCDPSLDADALPDLIERLRACQARVDNDPG